MAEVIVLLTLQNGQNENGYGRFAPGDELRGNLQIFADGDVNCKHLYLRLLWHTSGRGTQYVEKVAEQDLFQGVIPANTPRWFDFAFQLPHQPWSYQGHYINVEWKVQAQLDVPWAADPKGEVAFILRPSATTSPLFA